MVMLEVLLTRLALISVGLSQLLTANSSRLSSALVGIGIDDLWPSVLRLRKDLNATVIH